MASVAFSNCRLTTLYKRFNSAPILTGARIFTNDHLSVERSVYNVTVNWETLDVVRKERCTFAQNHLLSVNHQLGSVQSNFLCGSCVDSLGKGFPLPDQNGARMIWNIAAKEPGLRALCVEYTLSSALSATSRVTKACAPEDGCFVQIWFHETLLKTIRLPTFGSSACHGKVYPRTNVALTGAVWSDDSKEIVYVAEALANSERTQYEGHNPAHSVFHHQEDWGEALEGVGRTVLCLLNVASGQVSCLVDSNNLPGVAPAKPVWCPNQQGIVFLGYKLRAYYLGLQYCTQRPCQLYHLDIGSGEFRTLSDLTQAARCPSFSPDGNYLVWLENPVGGPHSQCATLKVLRWPVRNGDSPQTVVPYVDDPDPISGFPGLYGDLPERCWSADSRHVVMSSIWGFHLVPLLIRVDCGSNKVVPYSVTPMIPHGKVEDMHEPCSINVLDVHDDLICGSFESYTVPPVLTVFSLRSFISPTDASCVKPEWFFISPSGSISRGDLPSYHLSGIKQFSLTDSSHFANNSTLICPTLSSQSKQLEVIDLLTDRCFELELIERLESPDRIRGLIVWPHGGPHSAFTGAWSPLIAGFLASGFACLLINFRGSLGYGNGPLRSILGNIGKNDVEDCLTATNTALQRLQKLFDFDIPPVLFGGSHGGFLVLHLAARYPLMFHAVVARNPVTDLTSMTKMTDIPDWCFTEAGLLPEDPEWSRYSDINMDDFAQFNAMSPLTHLTTEWRAPLLLLLGAKDRRVPTSQGLAFYRKLKAICPTVPCEALILPHDAHPLESPVANAVTFFNTISWFVKHLE